DQFAAKVKQTTRSKVQDTRFKKNEIRASFKIENARNNFEESRYKREEIKYGKTKLHQQSFIFGVLYANHFFINVKNKNHVRRNFKFSKRTYG
ncbi:MAG: hypothetical protein M3R72_12250, partial [Bacteroidota bacterium]|nr:hypothetical protein [Bacteroidota bacterium]